MAAADRREAMVFECALGSRLPNRVEQVPAAQVADTAAQSALTLERDECPEHGPIGSSVEVADIRRLHPECCGRDERRGGAHDLHALRFGQLIERNFGRWGGDSGFHGSYRRCGAGKRGVRRRRRKLHERLVAGRGEGIA